jgi:hypothetical protein
LYVTIGTNEIMKLSLTNFACVAGLLLAGQFFTTQLSAASVRGWLDWRGPARLGISQEKGLPDRVDAKAALWAVPFPGQSAPVIANGKL